MEKKHVSKKVTATILSMSLLTVMAGAAIAPALGIIKAHYSDVSAINGASLSYPPFPKSATEVENRFGIIQNQSPDLQMVQAGT